MIILGIIGIGAVFGLILLLYKIMFDNAVEGWQDGETGFHYGKPPKGK